MSLPEILVPHETNPAKRQFANSIKSFAREVTQRAPVDGLVSSSGDADHLTAASATAQRLPIDTIRFPAGQTVRINTKLLRTLKGWELLDKVGAGEITRVETVGALPVPGEDRFLYLTNNGVADVTAKVRVF